MGLVSNAAAILDAGRLPAVAPAPREPQPVAFARSGMHGATLFVVERGDSCWMAIIVVLEHDSEGWNDLTVVHKPWLDPAEPLGPDELMLTAGHSRFDTTSGGELVVIGGRAAPETTILGDDDTAVVVHPPSRHFIALRLLDHRGESVALIARRGTEEQRDAFAPLDAPAS